MATRVGAFTKRDYPRKHRLFESYAFSAEAATANYATIFPIIMNDDALGAPETYNAHPQHASYIEESMPNCYPDSVIGKIRVILKLRLTLPAIAAGIRTIKFKYMPIYTAFLEDLNAIDELTSETLKTILQLQSEATDRQVYPLWNAVTGDAGYTAWHTNIPGLTAGAPQGIAWTDAIQDDYFEQKRFGMLGGLLRKVTPRGMRTVTISRDNPVKTVALEFRINPNVKRINPYTFCGVLLHLPQGSAGDTIRQDFEISDTTDIRHLSCEVRCLYDEWNDWDMGKV